MAGRKAKEPNLYRTLTPTEFVRKLEALGKALELADDDTPKVFVGEGNAWFLRQLVEHVLDLAGPEGEGTLAWYKEMCDSIDELEWGSQAQRISMRLVANRMMTETDPRARSEAEKEILRAVKSRAPEPKRGQAAGSVSIGDTRSELPIEFFSVSEDA